MAVNTVTVSGISVATRRLALCPLAIAWRISRWPRPSASRTAAAYGGTAPNGIASWSSGSWPAPARCISAKAARSCAVKALSEMGEGPPESACRSRFQTTTSCEGKEPWW
jgi:hypothetical protein